jgi:phosphopantothenoylcysteine decarboxylase/phosphopantothenate--cysteine ligase
VARGAASVTLIAANVVLPDPAGVEVVRVGTTEELRTATLAAAEDADVVVMAAAPADFRPARYAEQKIKKSDDGAAPVIELTLNPDVAAELGAKKPAGQVLVAFAAETAPPPQAAANARAKLARKGADLIVLNDVGEGGAFGSDVNSALVLDPSGPVATVERASKDDLADAVFDLTVSKLAESRVTPPG